MWGKSPDMRGSILPSPSQIPLETPAHHHVPPQKAPIKAADSTGGSGRVPWWFRTGRLCPSLPPLFLARSLCWKTRSRWVLCSHLHIHHIPKLERTKYTGQIGSAAEILRARVKAPKPPPARILWMSASAVSPSTRQSPHPTNSLEDGKRLRNSDPVKPPLLHEFSGRRQAR